VSVNKNFSLYITYSCSQSISFFNVYSEAEKMTATSKLITDYF